MVATLSFLLVFLFSCSPRALFVILAPWLYRALFLFPSFVFFVSLFLSSFFLSVSLSFCLSLLSLPTLSLSLSLSLLSTLYSLSFSLSLSLFLVLFLFLLLLSSFLLAARPSIQVPEKESSSLFLTQPSGATAVFKPSGRVEYAQRFPFCFSFLRITSRPASPTYANNGSMFPSSSTNKHVFKRAS